MAGWSSALMPPSQDRYFKKEFPTRRDERQLPGIQTGAADIGFGSKVNIHLKIQTKFV